MNQLLVSRLDVATLSDWAEGISGQWDGDLPGNGEDMASVAQEIIDTCNQLQGLLEEIEHYDYH